MPFKDLKDAIQQEALLFEHYYHWLEKSMPRIFFSEIKSEWISLICHSLMDFREQNYFSLLHLKNGAIALSIESPDADVRILQHFPLYGIKNYTTYVSKEPHPFPEKPGFLRIAIIDFTKAFEIADEPLPLNTIESLKKELQMRHPDWSDEKCNALLIEMDDRFIRKIPSERQIVALEMFERAQERDHCQYSVYREEEWAKKNLSSTSVILAWKNIPKHNFLYRLARVVRRHDLVMHKVNAAYLNPYEVKSIFMLSFELHGASGLTAWEATDFADFLQELVTVKFFGSQDIIDATFVETSLLSGNMGNLLRTAANFIHQVLVHVDLNLYNLENIEEALCRHPELTLKIAAAFEAKFRPGAVDLESFDRIRSEFLDLVGKLDTGHEYHDIRRKNVLLQGMNFVTHTLKTNFYKANKTAFSFRLDPLYLDHAPFDRKQLFPEMPFGIFFIKGMHFIAFHIRFKDLARGGLRTVYSKKKERMLAELNTVFTECYNLSLTQHYKNKDIPEGGAKAIIFLKPYAHLSSEAEILAQELKNAHLEPDKIQNSMTRFIEEQEIEYLYQTQRSFIKNLLVLVNCHKDGTLKDTHIVDYWKKPEYIYLGPDENMHDVMIEWIAAESTKEGYKPAGAFISGKPKVGINHKEYGVTSLGVNVYMEEVLRFLAIDPEKQSFTIKMTGGPDGDVAGNQILNLYKFYPNTAKLTALTDGSGTIFEPNGLHLETLVSLFHQGKPIAYYPIELLSSGAFLLDKEKKKESALYTQQTLCFRNIAGTLTEEWLSGSEMNALYRNNVHFTPADIFLPCGGRPRTLNAQNCLDFFDSTGRPNAKAIVEGANLYLSQEARSLLEEAGVLIIKDSSANKGGVICSSFEILCGLSLKNEEFVTHKPQLVAEILHKIKECALNEAELLLKEHVRTKKPLSELSDEISRRIHYFTDQLLNYYEIATPSEAAIQCFLHYCPQTLYRHFSERLLSEIPENHIKAVIASHVAAKLVYKRGMDWFPSLIDILPLIFQDTTLFH